MAVLASVTALALPARSEPPLEVRILSAVGDAAPDPSEKLTRVGTQVTLQLAVQSKDLGLVADAPEVVWDREAKPRKARAPLATEAWKVRWFKIEVAARSISNTDPTFHWEDVPYKDVPIAACDDRFRCPADLRATILGDRGGLGTMAYRVEVDLAGRTGASPGAERRYRGGLPAEIARVTIRRDESYLGFLTELFNTPYIWGSAGDPPKVHQAERRIGSDCADFVTYGVRRLGHDVPYTSTYGLPAHARLLFAPGAPDGEGVYRAGGKPVPIGEKGARPGDLLLFPRHVGALVRDEPPLGVLDSHDVMIHTCWAEPAEQPIAETDYGTAELKVYRWKVLDR